MQSFCPESWALAPEALVGPEHERLPETSVKLEPRAKIQAVLRCWGVRGLHPGPDKEGDSVTASGASPGPEEPAVEMK